MSPEEVREVLGMLPGVQTIKESPDGFIHCNCFLAPYTNDHTHDVDRKPSMWISTGSGTSFANCWTCNPNRRTFVDTLEYFNLVSSGRYTDAVERAKKLENWAPLYRRKDVYLPVDHSDDYRDRYETKTATAALPQDFLETKGIREKTTTRKYRLGTDASRGLITFPIITRNQRIVGALARSVMDDGAERRSKYFQLYTDCRKSHHLFGEHLLDLRKIKHRSGAVEYRYVGKEIIVLEGPLDVMHLDEIGATDTVAIMGSQVSHAQAEILHRYAREKTITIVLDPDSAGRHGAIESVNRVFTEAAPEANVRMLVPPKDPKQLNRKDLQELLSGEHVWQKQNVTSLLENLESRRRRSR